MTLDALRVDVGRLLEQARRMEDGRDARLHEITRLLIREGRLAASHRLTDEHDLDLLRAAVRQWMDVTAEVQAHVDPPRPLWLRWLDTTRAVQSVRNRVHTGIKRRETWSTKSSSGESVDSTRQ